MSSYSWAPGFIDDGDRPQIVTSRFQYEDGHTLERFLATGGYAGLKAALARTPVQVHDEVKAATVPPPPTVRVDTAGLAVAVEAVV